RVSPANLLASPTDSPQPRQLPSIVRPTRKRKGQENVASPARQIQLVFARHFGLLGQPQAISHAILHSVCEAEPANNNDERLPAWCHATHHDRSSHLEQLPTSWCLSPPAPAPVLSFAFLASSPTGHADHMTPPPTPTSASSSFLQLSFRPSQPIASPSLRPALPSLAGLPLVHPGTCLSLAGSDSVPHILMAFGVARIELMGLWKNGEHLLAGEGTQDTCLLHLGWSATMRQPAGSGPADPVFFMKHPQLAN
ncbi:hypothetical protein K456DRAFT_1934183, partial [Colletotrichum gloeosporioides 23]